MSAQINNYKSQNLISTDLSRCRVLAYRKYLKWFPLTRRHIQMGWY